MNKQHVANGRAARDARVKSAQDREGGGSPEPSRQVAILDERLGKGVGATKERARLAKQMGKMSDAKPPKKGKKK